MTNLSDLKNFILAFLKETGLGSEPIELQEFSGDGSSRAFWRISLSQSARSFIAMANPPNNNFLNRENLAYLMIGKHLRTKGVPVPEIYRYNLEHGWFIMEDLGRTDLQELVSSKENPLPHYEEVLEHLFRLQIEGAEDFDPSWCCQTPTYDRTVMRQYESNYFRDAFLRNYLGLDRDWPELEAPFDYLAEVSSNSDGGFFLHRDFQSRNIMISASGSIGFVDWQGGRLGPLGYDLASLIIDPYTCLSSQQKSDLLQAYTSMIREYKATWVESFKRSFPYLAIQRNLQILGAFAFLTRERNKPHFEAYIPPAQKNLRELLHQVNDPRLSPLMDVLEDICD
jgi:aminoglycoside/choline kinase family phosphotransferase